MRRNLLVKYVNGNYVVRLYSDGTKIKETKDDYFISSFPDSMDLKITNYCDLNCPMCHEKSSTSGDEGDLNSPFFNTLPSGMELAIGGGNPLSHSGLVPFLIKMKRKKIICNLTINEVHLLKNKVFVQELIDKRLIYGLGVSLKNTSSEVLEFASLNKNVVLHIINGVFKDFDKIINKDLKILILGYKKFGRGNDYYSEEIENNMRVNKENIQNYFECFSCISFDNLALEQLDIKSLVSKEEWDSFYMGDDGEASMYIDLVNKEFARSSVSTLRFPLKDNLIEMFNVIKK